METNLAVPEVAAEPILKDRPERSGRAGRAIMRAAGTANLGRPFIIRNIPTYDVLSEENLNHGGLLPHTI